jgi:hypothetical protein
VAIGLAVALVATYGGALGLLHIVPRYDCVVFPLVAFSSVWLLAEVRGRALLLALLGISTILATAVLTHLWTTGHEGRSAILLGIVPYSDAGAFYADAERMLYGLRFEESSRRPLYVGVAGALLRWTGDDLRTLLVLSTLAYGAAMGFVVWEVMRLRHPHGAKVGAFVLVIVFFWVRRFTGFVATEALSFPLGALGFGLLVRTVDIAETRSKEAAVAFGAGLFTITLAFVARPGSLLVVPALLLWSRWGFQGRWRTTALASGGAGVAAAVLSTRALAGRLASGPTFGDYPAIAYGLLHRGELQQVGIDHPELGQIEPAERARVIFGWLYHDVLHDPAMLVMGPADALFSFLGGAHGLFSFVWTNPDDHVLENGPLVRRLVAEHGYVGPILHWVHELGVLSLVNAIVMGVLGGAFVLGTFVALVRLFRARREPRNALFLCVMAGIIASSIFAPTWIGEGMQMQTAIFAFVPTAVALGLFAVRVPVSAPDPVSVRRLALVTVTVPVFLGALVIATCALPLTPDRSGCGPGVMSARLSPSTRVVLRSSAEPSPNERSLALNFEFLQKHNPDLVESVKAVARVGDVVDVVYDACLARTRIVFGPPEVLPASQTWKTLRFEAQKDPTVARVALP